MQLMDDCDAGLIDLILTKSVSRFARDTIDWLRSVRHLKSIGVEVRFEREGVSTFSADGELLITLLASFAQAESESVSRNVRWLIAKKFVQGIPNGHRSVYGYRWDGERYQIIADQGKIVRYIYKEYLEGRTAYSIGKELREKGVSVNGSALFSDSTVKDILSNIVYTGMMHLQKYFIDEDQRKKRNIGQLPAYLVEGIYEPLISAEDFDKVQTLRKRRAEELRKEETILPFSGMVKCGFCGHSFSRRTHRDKKKWVCNTRERKGKDACDMPPLNEAELMAAACKAMKSSSYDAYDFRQKVSHIKVFGDRLEFRMTNGTVKKVSRFYDGFKERNAFSGRIICGNCGIICQRDTLKDGTHIWNCINRSECGLKGIDEKELERIISNAFKTKTPGGSFVQKVRHATLTNDKIIFEPRYRKEKDGDESNSYPRNAE